MKKVIAFFTILFFCSFNKSSETVFTSLDGKIKIKATKDWNAAGNMKGVEIYISKILKENSPQASLVVSKDINLPEGTDLSTYSAGKLFLQTSVLNTSPSFTGIKKIHDNKFIYYEYEYDNKNLVKMKTLVYHTLILLTGYQMVITAPKEGFDELKPIFNKIGNSLIISP
tara:strand:- start:1646 stop:2155 length:510 start_codon:yes stop_codon:yes gene_type:complete